MVQCCGWPHPTVVWSVKKWSHFETLLRFMALKIGQREEESRIIIYRYLHSTHSATCNTNIWHKTKLECSLCLEKENINTLKSCGNYIYHLLFHLLTLYFAHRVYLWISCVSQNKQWLFLKQNWPTYFCNADAFCFVWGKNCIFKYNLYELRAQKS
jgi:hypothetical protein